MTTLGQQPHELPVLELAEADGAVGGPEQSSAGFVLGDGDGPDRRLIEPDSPDVPHMVNPAVPVVLEKGAATAAATVGSLCRREGRGDEGPADTATAQDGAEGEGEEEGGGEEGGGDEDVVRDVGLGPVACVGCWR